MIYDVIVIGGGPSGMMVAGRAGELGKKVLLLEKNNNLGEKLKITGNGRCNITNATSDLRLLLKNFGKAEKFLYSAFVQFGVEETINFFESRGLAIKIEDHNRAFPVSENAYDVVNLLHEYLKHHHVVIKTNTTVSQLKVKNNRIVGVIVAGKLIEAKNVVIATGGASHPETGSTGDGFKWLENLGCEVVKPTASVTPLAIKESWVKNLSGVALDNVKLSFICNNKKVFSKQGRVLCTHFGISGPLVLNSSAKVSDLLKQGQVTISIDLFPQADHKQLDDYLLSKFADNINCSLLTVLKFVLPPGTTKEIVKVLNIDPQIKVNSLSRSQRVDLVKRLKDIKLTVKSLMGLDRSVVVDGGLSLKEVDGKTMRVKKSDNLYVTGDVLHIRRPSGGYSLQLCWTTGYVVANNL